MQGVKGGQGVCGGERSQVWHVDIVSLSLDASRTCERVFDNVLYACIFVVVCVAVVGVYLAVDDVVCVGVVSDEIVHTGQLSDDGFDGGQDDHVWCVCGVLCAFVLSVGQFDYSDAYETFDASDFFNGHFGYLSRVWIQCLGVWSQSHVGLYPAKRSRNDHELACHGIPHATRQ